MCMLRVICVAVIVPSFVTIKNEFMVCARSCVVYVWFLFMCGRRVARGAQRTCTYTFTDTLHLLNILHVKLQTEMSLHLHHIMTANSFMCVI